MLLGCLLSCDRGVIICCNIVDGLEAGLYGPGFVREVFDWWQALCTHTATTDPERTIIRLRDLTFDGHLKNLPVDFRPGVMRPQLAFKANRTIRNSSRNKRIATAIPANYLRQKLSNDDLIRFESVHGVTFPVNRTEWTRDLIERIQKLPIGERTFAVQALEPLHPICVWYTREDDLKLKLENAINPSNTVRDVLGLVHYEDATPIAILYLQHTELTHGADDRPTFAEACDNRRFRACGDLAVSKRGVSWGQAADLEKVARAQVKIDGCPERIAEPIPHKFQVKFEILGLTSGLRGVDGGSDSDAGFANILLAKTSPRRSSRTKAQVERHLRRVLK